MQVRRVLIGVLVGVGTVCGVAAQTQAQDISVGNFLSDLFRGTEFAGNPLFLSVPQNGPLFEFNDFTQRLEFNRAGGGFTYEFFRFFGPDTFGNINALDLGPLKVQLTPDATLGQFQRVGFHGRTGFTTTLIPEVFFQAQTGQRTFDQFSGVTGFSMQPIQYSVTFNTGIQDFELNGNLLIDGGGRINMFGFYDFDMRFTNVGSATADGVALQDEQVSDFDVGPINVSGNIGFDILSGLLQSAGLDVAAAPPRIVSGAAQKGKTVDDLLAQLEAGEGLTDAEAQFLVQQMFVTAFLNDPIGTLLNGFPSEVPGFEALSVNLSPAEIAPETAPSQVPEPGTLVLVVLGFAFCIAMRPMLRRRRPTRLLY